MANCKLISSIPRDCEYNTAGLRRLYLFNYDAAVSYSANTDGVITAITLPTNEKIYKMEFADASASFTDDLTVGSNNNKYRVPTVNFILNGLAIDTLNQQDALSLGTFVALCVDKNGKVTMLGSDNGLNATTDNYASGAADGDANGWTVVLVGSENSTLKLVESEAVFKSQVDMITVTP